VLDLTHALGAIALCMVPLAVEIEWGQRDTAGLLEPTKRVTVLREHTMPPAVIAPPWVAGELETVTVDRVTPRALTALLDRETALEWTRVRSLAVAVRLTRSTDHALQLVGIPEAQWLHRDDAVLLCGPYDVPGLRVRPPALFEFADDYGTARLKLVRYASLVQSTDEPEFHAFEGVFSSLERRGWTREVFE
jgi:hypothetical protein